MDSRILRNAVGSELSERAAQGASEIPGDPGTSGMAPLAVGPSRSPQKGGAVTPPDAETMARWLGTVRAEAPGLSLASLEAFLWVAAGCDSREEVETSMCQAAPLARETVSRALGILRGRAQWRGDHWLQPLTWLEGRPHPHIKRAIAYRVSQRGSELLSIVGIYVLQP